MCQDDDTGDDRRGALGVQPADCVFLDDLGVNLKPARAMGMTTIKVDAPGAALAELERVLGELETRICAGSKDPAYMDGR